MSKTTMPYKEALEQQMANPEFKAEYEKQERKAKKRKRVVYSYPRIRLEWDAESKVWVCDDKVTLNYGYGPNPLVALNDYLLSVREWTSLTAECALTCPADASTLKTAMKWWKIVFRPAEAKKEDA